MLTKIQIVLTTICLQILGAQMKILYMINAKILVLIIDGETKKVMAIMLSITPKMVSIVWTYTQPSLF